MKGNVANKLILVGDTGIESYNLDLKVKWNVGRPTSNNCPDIPLRSPIISRDHGYFRNINGVWGYIDKNSKNGTLYNGTKMSSGLKNRYKTVLVNDGDTFLFGGGEEYSLNGKNILGVYVNTDLGDDWEIIDVREYSQIVFETKECNRTIRRTNEIYVIKQKSCMAIYTGDIVYKIGDIDVTGV